MEVSCYLSVDVSIVMAAMVEITKMIVAPVRAVAVTLRRINEDALAVPVTKVVTATIKVCVLAITTMVHGSLIPRITAVVPIGS